MKDISDGLARFDTEAFPLAALVGGIDEAGRGPLFGPVVAACVVLPRGVLLPFVNDSKKLTARTRDRLYADIMGKAASVGVGEASVDEIAALNIRNASRLAMERAVLAACPADGYLIDYERDLRLPAPQKSFVRGDALSQCVAAAGIVAKVTRDRMMIVWDDVYPGYGLARHKGYGTLEHKAALARLGLTPQHRSSFIHGL